MTFPKIVAGTFNGLAGQEIDLFRAHLSGVTGVGVEIGCLDGFSTVVILESSELSSLTSIDPFIPDSMEKSLIGDKDRFFLNTAPFNGRSKLIQDYSWNVSPTWRDKLDFLFIDGDHTLQSVTRDYLEWTPLLKQGGILAVHDCRMGRPDSPTFHVGPSKMAMEQIFGRPDRWELLGETFSLVLARLR
jgi:predicted O-methyltransferase YrrM